MAEILLECILQAVGQLRKKEAFPKGPLVGCLLGLGTTAAAYVETRGTICVVNIACECGCVYLTRVEEGLPGASVEGI